MTCYMHSSLASSEHAASQFQNRRTMRSIADSDAYAWTSSWRLPIDISSSICRSQEAMLSLIVLLSTMAASFLQHRWKQARLASTEQSHRKNRFLKQNLDDYGYRRSPKGFIDKWRFHEIPGLLRPENCTTQYTASEAIVYLDYGGSSLPWKSQLQKMVKNDVILANPHSSPYGPAAVATKRRVQEVSRRVYRLLDANESDYELMFTSGSTEALRIVAEYFSCDSGSRVAIPTAVHTSVLGMVGPLQSRGAEVIQRHWGELVQNLWRLDYGSSNNLLVVPLECNWGGDSLQQEELASQIKELQRQHQYSVCIDATKAVATRPVSVHQLNRPTFVCLSFAKLCGAPTGLGALLIRRDRRALLRHDPQRDYYGGGSPAAFEHRVDRPLTYGTPHYRGVVELGYGLDVIEQQLGGMHTIWRHTVALAKELVLRLRELRHVSTNRPLVCIYGTWQHWNKEAESSRNYTHVPGPTVTFNIQRADGSFVGCSQVAKLVALVGNIQLRSGCHCNSGACRLALGWSGTSEEKDDDLMTHVCGDERDFYKGQPTGAIRVSLGKESIWEDVDALICLLDRLFIEEDASVSKQTLLDDVAAHQSTSTELVELNVFPIKSCAAQRVASWPLDIAGQLWMDRAFCLVHNGKSLRLQTYPLLALVQPKVDYETKRMIVSAPGQVDLEVMLEDAESSINEEKITVCGSTQCSGVYWGDKEAIANWFHAYLGVPCWLAKHVPSQPVPREVSSFANEQSLLLVAQDAVDELNELTTEKSTVNPPIDIRQFRANLIVHRSPGKEWVQLRNEETGIKLSYIGSCQRCGMIEVNPEKGSLRRGTLRAVANFQRQKKRQQQLLSFGSFVKVADTCSSTSKDTTWLHQGMQFHVT